MLAAASFCAALGRAQPAPSGHSARLDEVRYVLLDKHDNNQETWAAPHNVLVAVGKLASPDSLTRWAKEVLTGYNKRVLYLHTKVLLVDPISARPIVISGSANFSVASTSTNDENMLVIVGDTDLADVYLTEYARIFL
jgi:phosphatidylserine/phosphatidylglycerophosphate/cardiolipin synthase-like enzyme